MSDKEEQPNSEQVPLETIVNRPMDFRVWDDRRKELLHFKLHDTDQGYHIEHGVSIDEMPTMQFCGLKDKHGIKIFAGDIVADSEMTYVVKFGEYDDSLLDDLAFGWFMENIEDDVYKAMQFVLYANTDQLEVIGNVYENPELLQKGG
ncbi:YopX family protein [Gracilimonas sediminicola]|uniref:YopX family protein n=1 Tax=Gracilimonas sediminicola TaxID=2952158 RepID=A0A9X2L0C9_9BACT|nr:YopX family protein [Gracilimonas sediminicola]MCP9290016.1 YopX family protein [Gracilimonas sediminicola]